MASATVVLYRELEEGEGLAVKNGSLCAYKDGVVVAEGVAPEKELRQMMLDYDVLALLPEVSFCHQQRPEEFEAIISLNTLSLPGEVSGIIVIDDDQQYWVARWCGHPDFMRAHEVPTGGRPWADNSSGWGWEFMLPGAWQTHPDPLVPRRLALALEAFLDDLASERELAVPYRRVFNNIFSAKHPAWRINLPRIISIEQRAPSDLV